MDTTSNHIQQLGEDTCAIKAQQLILEDFGINISEPNLVKYSIENGWYRDGAGVGTKIEDVGRILDAAKIPCTSRIEANMYDLANELQQGHKVIVAVDSGELWKEDSLLIRVREWFENLFGDDKPDHALIVAGIDASDPNDVKVLVTDPGTGDKERAYPLKDFMDAWQDSKFFMCSTNVAPPDIAQQYHENAVETGDETWDKMEMPKVADVDNETFHQFVDYSHSIQPCDFTKQMPSLYNSFCTMPMNPGWGINDALAFNNLPLFDPMMPVYPVSMPSPILPCDFNYDSLLDTSWMSIPYTPMCFPPVSPLPLDPVFQPITTPWYSPANDMSWYTPQSELPGQQSFPFDVEDGDDKEPTEDETDETLEDQTEEFHEEISHELSEVDMATNDIEIPSTSAGFPDIDINEED